MKIGEVSIYSRKLKFRYIDTELLQEKIDLLFTTSRLMGYPSMLEHYYNNVYTIGIYHKGKSFMIHFHILKDCSEDYVAAVSGFIGNEKIDISYDEMERLLEEVERILVYI